MYILSFILGIIMGRILIGMGVLDRKMTYIRKPLNETEISSYKKEINRILNGKPLDSEE